MLNEGWRDQHSRMKRALQEMVSHGTGRSGTGGSAEARDAVIHFFEDAYHLKDWLINDTQQTAASKREVEDAVSKDLALRVCADLCNGLKHLVLSKARTGDIGTAIASQGVTVGVPPLVANVGADHDPKAVESPQGWAEHVWTVRSNEVNYDVERLADDVVDAWDRWLSSKGLLP